MKLNQDLGELSTRGKAALLGAMALCCVVPMLLVFGAVSVTGALFGGTALVIVGAAAVLAWGVWMGRHHRHMAEHGDPGDSPTCCGGHGEGDPVLAPDEHASPTP